MAWSDEARRAAVEARRRRRRLKSDPGKGLRLVTIGHGSMATLVTRNSRAAMLRVIRTTPAVRSVPFHMRRVATHATATVAHIGAMKRAAAFAKRGGPSKATRLAMAARERMHPSSELVGRKK